MVDISFVVPVYNVQDYVQECIESILLIKNLKYEIIVVNDGSTDNSLCMVEQFSHLSNVKIISQDNRGLSAARNIGFSQSQGKYVAFIDSDDKIDANNFIELFEKGMSASSNIDILFGDFYDWKNSTICRSSLGLSDIWKGTGRDMLVYNYPSNINSVVWRGVYRRDFLAQNQLYFEEGLFFEDVEWMPRVLYQAKYVVYLPIPFYYYRLRGNSIMTSIFTHKKFKDCVLICQKHILYSIGKEPMVASVFLNNAFYCLYKAISCYPDSYKSDSICIIKSLTRIEDISFFSKLRMLYTAYSITPRVVATTLQILYRLKTNITI